MGFEKYISEAKISKEGIEYVQGLEEEVEDLKKQLSNAASAFCYNPRIWRGGFGWEIEIYESFKSEDEFIARMADMVKTQNSLAWEELNDRIDAYNNLPWYKKIFTNKV